MPLQQGRLYEFVLRANYLSQEVLNVFHYRQLDEDDENTLEEMADEFADEVAVPMATVQVNALQYNDLRVREFGGVLEHTKDMDFLVGDRAEAPLASFYALNFKIQRVQIDCRNGSKRLAGIPEEGVSGNVLNAPYSIDVEAMEQVFGLALFEGQTNNMKPTIYRVGSFENGEWFGCGSVSSQFTAVSTQRSRKLREGVGT